MRHARWAVGRRADSLHRQARAHEIERLYQEITAGWDRAQFVETFREYWDPFPRVDAPKYLSLDTWLRRAIEHYLLQGLFDGIPGRRVLDLGCGMGYFLAVCRHHGHEVMGIDLDDEPIYNLSVQFLGIPRRVHRIEPSGPMPGFDETFDVVTAFMTCFNLLPDGRGWTADDWATFLPQLHGLMRPRGKALIQFNIEPATGRLFAPDLPIVVRKYPGFRGRFFREYLRLEHVD